MAMQHHCAPHSKVENTVTSAYSCQPAFTAHYHPITHMTVPVNSALHQCSPTSADKEVQNIFPNHCNMDDALKSLLIKAMEEVYLAERNLKFTGFMDSTTRDLIMHFLDRYGKITITDLDLNAKQMKEPFNPSLPISA